MDIIKKTAAELDAITMQNFLTDADYVGQIIDTDEIARIIQDLQSLMFPMCFKRHSNISDTELLESIYYNLSVRSSALSSLATTPTTSLPMKSATNF